MAQEIVFFNRLTEQLVEQAGVNLGSYEFFYQSGGCKYPLKKKGRSKGKAELVDPKEIWNIEQDGLFITREIIVEHPQFLLGADGVVSNPEGLGLCVVCVDRKLCTTQVIQAEEDKETSIWRFKISHAFQPGEVSNSITLSINFFLKQAPSSVLEEEQCLSNVQGSLLGTLEDYVVGVDDSYSMFPILEDEDSAPDKPFWRLHLATEWENPAVDEFANEENVCVLLNTKSQLYKKASRSLMQSLFLEILPVVYWMIIKALRARDERGADGGLDQARTGRDVSPGSICDAVHNLLENSGNAIKISKDDDLGLLSSLREYFASLQTEEVE